MVLSDPPVFTDLADKLGRITGKWLSWITDPGSGDALGLAQAIAQAVGQPVNAVQLTSQNAAIATTSFPLGSFPGGLYRLSWYLRVTTADGVASSVTVTFGWTEGGLALTASGSAVTGDTTSTFQTGSAPLILTDAGSPITYATAYSSNTPNKMNYELMLTIEGPFN